MLLVFKVFQITRVLLLHMHGLVTFCAGQHSHYAWAQMRPMNLLFQLSALGDCQKARIIFIFSNFRHLKCRCLQISKTVIVLGLIYLIFKVKVKMNCILEVPISLHWVRAGLEFCTVAAWRQHEFHPELLREFRAWSNLVWINRKYISYIRSYIQDNGR